MAFRLKSASLKDITHSLAIRFHNMKSTPGERPYSERRSDALKEKLFAGKALVFLWVIGILDGEKYRINGQHSSRLLEECPNLINNLKVNLNVYKCDNAVDLGELYIQFDSMLGVKTTSDVNLAYARSFESLDHVIGSVITRCVTATALNMWGEGYVRKSREDRAKLVHGNIDFILFVSDLKESFHHKHWRVISRAPVMLAILKTWKRVDDKSRDSNVFEFWRLVASAEHVDNEHPTRVLNRYLLSTSVATGGGVVHRRMNPAEHGSLMYNKYIIAWNAWRSGQRTTALKVFRKRRLGETQYINP